MTERACSLEDCTVSETGKCLQSHENYERDCPNYKKTSDGEESSPLETQEISESPPEPISKEQYRLFPFGMELGVQEAAEIMRQSYTKLIGIVGETNVGKTCFLISLYLIFCQGDIEKYRFAGSRTLQGFEHRARYLRQWTDAKLGDKLSERTVLQDPRSPGLLHLSIQETTGDSLVHNLLFTDLPGEWFSSLIKNVDASKRLAFLKRADGIILAIDAEQLFDPNTRHEEIIRAEFLIARLVETIQISTEIPFVFLITKCDSVYDENSNEEDIIPTLPGIDAIVETANRKGLFPSVVYSAAVSRIPEKIPAGYGVIETLDKLIHTLQGNNKDDDIFVKHYNKDWRSFARYRGRMY